MADLPKLVQKDLNVFCPPTSLLFSPPPCTLRTSTSPGIKPLLHLPLHYHKSTRAPFFSKANYSLDYVLSCLKNTRPTEHGLGGLSARKLHLLCSLPLPIFCLTPKTTFFPSEINGLNMNDWPATKIARGEQNVLPFRHRTSKT